MGDSSTEPQLTEEHVIIIACVCGVIIVTLLIVLFCFIFRRRRNAAKNYQGGNQGDPPPYNAVPPSKKPQGYDNQGMDTSDIQLTTSTSSRPHPTALQHSPTPSVHAISTGYTNSSYGPLELNYLASNNKKSDNHMPGNNYKSSVVRNEFETQLVHPTDNNNRLDGFQNRDNPVSVPRSPTKDKYIDLHDRGGDPMMRPEGGYSPSEPASVGVGGKPKKVIYEVVV